MRPLYLKYTFNLDGHITNHTSNSVDVYNGMCVRKDIHWNLSKCTSQQIPNTVFRLFATNHIDVDACVTPYDIEIMICF